MYFLAVQIFLLWDYFCINIVNCLSRTPIHPDINDYISDYKFSNERSLTQFVVLESQFDEFPYQVSKHTHFSDQHSTIVKN